MLTTTRGDYDLAVKTYKANAKFGYLVPYPRSTVLNVNNPLFSNPCVEKYLIQVGNSSDPSNRHDSILKILKNKQLLQDNEQIFIPLSYPKVSINYRDQLINKIKTMFPKEKVIVLKDFLSLENYCGYLNHVKVALFNHNQQEGLGNILLLMSFGVTIYIPSDTTLWDFCCEHNLLVKDIKDLSCCAKIELLSQNEIQKNKQTVLNQFGELKALETWRNIFCDIDSDNLTKVTISN